jgi:hypothetical protein
MTWTRLSSLVSLVNVAILKLVPSGIFTLICLPSCFLIRLVGGTYGIGGCAPDFPFLHSEAFKPSGGDLRLELMEYFQSGISRIRRLKDDLAGMRRTSSTRSP